MVRFGALCLLALVAAAGQVGCARSRIRADEASAGRGPARGGPTPVQLEPGELPDVCVTGQDLKPLSQLEAQIPLDYLSWRTNRLSPSGGSYRRRGEQILDEWGEPCANAVDADCLARLSASSGARYGSYLIGTRGDTIMVWETSAEVAELFGPIDTELEGRLAAMVTVPEATCAGDGWLRRTTEGWEVTRRDDFHCEYVTSFDTDGVYIAASAICQDR